MEILDDANFYLVDKFNRRDDAEAYHAAAKLRQAYVQKQKAVDETRTKDKTVRKLQSMQL